MEFVSSTIDVCMVAWDSYYVGQMGAHQKSEEENGGKEEKKEDKEGEKYEED